ncbi:MAG: AAA family ATPase [Ruminococcus sp.]|nr:AAA family ATPase [Ruminococcus sp.]
MDWSGNDKVFKTYVKGNPKNDGKAPIEKIKGREHIATFEEAEKSDCFGGVLRDGYIDISFDDSEMSERFLAMAKANNWKCLVLKNPDSNHVHSYWKNEQGSVNKKSIIDTKLAVGFIADVHGGATYIPLRVHGVDRFPPVYDIIPGEEYQEVPEELLPVNTQINLWKQDEGGRNDGLSRMAKRLVHDKSGYFDKDTIRRILRNTNKFVLAEPLEEQELKNILRDETFDGIDKVPKLKFWSGVELSQMEIKPVEFIVEGLIPVGLQILASPPKYGKSWFCLDMSISVANGRDFLGFKTNKCDVLHLSLEDRLDRLKQREMQILGDENLPSNLCVSIESATLGNGFIEQLEDFLTIKPNTKLIIVDTFVKVRGETKRNESAYAADSREAGVIKKFADDHNIAVVLVTHTRKGIDPDDPVANITGTYGIVGVADNSIVLSRQKRSDKTTKMSLTGRDVEPDEKALTFDKKHGMWILQDDSYDNFMVRAEIERIRMEYHVGNTRKTIVKLLEDNGGVWSGFCKEIIEKSKEYGIPITLTSQKLGKELAEINGFLDEDGIAHTEISRGKGMTVKHKFEKIEKIV